MDRYGLAWPAGFRCAAAITFDVDGESSLLGMDAASQHRLGLVSHQAYGPTTGLYRILSLLADLQLPATFFVSGYVARRYPASVKDIARDGHEIAHHGYIHKPMSETDVAMERRFIAEGFAALYEACGVRPVGYRAPGWDMSWTTPELLAENGFLYDSTLMDSDIPYEMGVDVDGVTHQLIELPINWALDDWSQYCMVPGFYDYGRIETPDRVIDMWRAEFDAIHDERGLFTLVNHPFLSGRPSRAAALRKFLRHVADSPDVWVATMSDIARHVRSCELEPRPLIAPIA